MVNLPTAKNKEMKRKKKKKLKYKSPADSCTRKAVTLFLNSLPNYIRKKLLEWREG